MFDLISTRPPVLCDRRFCIFGLMSVILVWVNLKSGPNMVGVRGPSVTLFWLLEVNVYFNSTTRVHKCHHILNCHTFQKTFSIDCTSQSHSCVQELLILLTTPCSLNEPDNRQLIIFFFFFFFPLKACLFI